MGRKDKVDIEGARAAAAVSLYFKFYNILSILKKDINLLFSFLCVVSELRAMDRHVRVGYHAGIVL